MTTTVTPTQRDEGAGTNGPTSSNAVPTGDAGGRESESPARARGSESLRFRVTPPSALASELLGRPPERRVLIVNADDFGMDAGVNRAVVEAFDHGIVTSCSLMVPGSAAAGAIAVLRARPDLPFGVHLTLVRDSAALVWTPVAGREAVPSLVDASGHLRLAARADELLTAARPDEVEAELRAQLGAVLDAGLTPTHLDWHRLADGGRDDLHDLALGLADEHGLAVRVWLGPARRRARDRGLPVIDHPFLDSFTLDVEGKTATCVELLRRLPAGLSEWAVHPGSSDARSRAIDGARPVRSTDLAALTSREVRDAVREEGIELIDYSEVRRAWVAARP